MDQQQQLQPFHTFPLILTYHSFALSAHFFGLTLLRHLCNITSSFFLALHLSNPGSRHVLSLPSCCLCYSSTVSLAWHAALPSLELFIIFSNKKNYRETPASLKLTVSFPASFLLNTKQTLLAFLIINAQGSIQQKETTCLFSFQPKIAPDDFTYCNDSSQTGGTDQWKHLLYSDWNQNLQTLSSFTIVHLYK